MDLERPDEERIDLWLEAGEVVPSVLLDPGECLVLVESKIEEEDRALHPRSRLERVVVVDALRQQFNPLGAVRTHADQGGDLRARGRVIRPRWREVGHEGRGEPHHRGVLDQYVLERRELRAEAVAGSGLQLGEAVGHAEVEELDQFGGESVVEAGVAVEGFGGPLVVDMAELVEGALEVDPGLEGNGPEEGDGIDLAVAADEPTLLGEALEYLGGEQFEEGILKQGRREGVSVASSDRGHPGSSWREV